MEKELRAFLKLSEAKNMKTAFHQFLSIGLLEPWPGI